MQTTPFFSDRHQPKVIRPTPRHTPPYVPSCPWRLTYLSGVGLQTATIDAVHVEDAALLISRGIPIRAEFDDRRSNCWADCHSSVLSRLWNNPVLARQQKQIDELEADHAQPQF